MSRARAMSRTEVAAYPRSRKSALATSSIACRRVAGAAVTRAYLTFVRQSGYSARARWVKPYTPRRMSGGRWPVCLQGLGRALQGGGLLVAVEDLVGFQVPDRAARPDRDRERG